MQYDKLCGNVKANRELETRIGHDLQNVTYMASFKVTSNPSAYAYGRLSKGSTTYTLRTEKVSIFATDWSRPTTWWCGSLRALPPWAA